ncbi:DUF4241 domain-containing protein [Spirillospora sp. NPDC048819]|uniref:DUF4241 domain-containing protein n=1 Tax=Spirillospora sp. NPDC048819 TaxID=3155268 RepID=UPI00340E5B33
MQPFIVTVPPGRYPVTLSISHWERSPVPHIPSPMRLVNAAKLNVRAEPAVSWELDAATSNAIDRRWSTPLFVPSISAVSRFPPTILS